LALWLAGKRQVAVRRALVVTVLALWVVIHSINLGAVMAAMGRAAPLGLGVVGLVAAVQFALLVWRWQFVIRVLCGKTVGFGAFALLLGHSFLIGQPLPSSVGGDVARIALLSRSTGAAAAARSGRPRLMAVALGIVTNLIGVVLIYVIGQSIGAGLPAWDCLVLVPPALFASALQISLGGWGVREGALLGAFSLIQLDTAAVAATPLIFGLTTPLEGVVTAAITPLARSGDFLGGVRRAK
jgi:glycosyltransferase 2 family protein